jgi:hypothetical protein
MAHGEVKTYQLTPEELAEVIEKYGEPTQPLNTYKSRWYKSDPETRKSLYQMRTKTLCPGIVSETLQHSPFRR